MSAIAPMPESRPGSPHSVRPSFHLATLADLHGARQSTARWIWDGFLAGGNITLLTSLWKTGKTTLVSVLVSRMDTGGMLAGLPLREGRVVVVSEESHAHWSMRHARLPIGPHARFICRPFPGGSTAEQWLALIEELEALRAAEGLDLLVIDPLAGLLPLATENSAACMLAALEPLRRLTSAGVCVLLNHHPRKAESAAGQAARGSGALAGYVDIVVEMSWFGLPFSSDRRRRLTAFSRYPETPRRMVIEWTADGADYVGLEDCEEPANADGPGVLLGVLAGGGGRLTRQQIRETWPAGLPAPSNATLHRWLGHGVSEGLIFTEGSGRRNDPFIYQLAGGDESTPD